MKEEKLNELLSNFLYWYEQEEFDDGFHDACYALGGYLSDNFRTKICETYVDIDGKIVVKPEGGDIRVFNRTKDAKGYYEDIVYNVQKHRRKPF